MCLVSHIQILSLCLVFWRAVVLLCQTHPLSLQVRAEEVCWLPLHAARCTPYEELGEEQRRNANRSDSTLPTEQPQSI